MLENKNKHAVYNWLAPEILAGHSPMPISDLYSLVCVIWEILNGKLCFSQTICCHIKHMIRYYRDKLLPLSIALYM